MKITETVRIEMLAFRLAVEDVELVALDGMVEFVPEFLLVYFAKREGENWELSELTLMRGNRFRQAWPCPVPDEVQSWIDAKLAELRGGEPVKT